MGQTGYEALGQAFGAQHDEMDIGHAPAHFDACPADGIQGCLCVLAVVVVPWSKAWRTWNRHGFRGATSRHNLGELDGRYHGRESHGIHSRYRYKEWHDIRGEQRGKKRA